jgi:hypothetical protein
VAFFGKNIAFRLALVGFLSYSAIFFNCWWLFGWLGLVLSWLDRHFVPRMLLYRYNAQLSYWSTLCFAYVISLRMSLHSILRALSCLLVRYRSLLDDLHRSLCSLFTIVLRTLLYRAAHSIVVLVALVLYLYSLHSYCVLTNPPDCFIWIACIRCAHRKRTCKRNRAYHMCGT